MNITSVTLVYFSPTGTTRSVLHAIAEGINPLPVRAFDMTKPDSREDGLQLSDDTLLVVGVPVYMGRVPALITDCLKSIQASNTPAVAVVVYGNRVYDNALLELKDILTDCGCIPIAGGAYIGEHSFADTNAPVALGRPDTNDLDHARQFGTEILGKLNDASESSLTAANIPGSYPYEGTTELWDVDFISVSEDCTMCGACAKACPVSAVSPDDSAMIDIEKCITCCACIKTCPRNARTIKSGPVKEAQKRLSTLFIEPRQPEMFL